MWRWLQQFLTLQPKPTFRSRVLDFTHPDETRWLDFVGGDNLDAHFVIRGYVRKGDDVLARLCSGRIGRYTLFSVRPNFEAPGVWIARGILVSYYNPVAQPPRLAKPTSPQIKGLLGPGTGGIRSDPRQLTHLPLRFTEPSSEFWKILARNEARRGWANSLRSAGNL